MEFHLPTKIILGPASLESTAQEVAALGSKAMIVCDPFSVETKLAARIAALLAAANISSVIYDQVIPNPTSTLIDAGAEIARSKGCDVMIGLGGGSSMDAAKGIAVAASHDGPIWPYAMGEKEITDATLPVVAITTTSGTGSQCTMFSVITNPETNQKPGMGSPFILPRVAIVDPELTRTMPPVLTAITGFDVFTHAVEAYTSNACSPLSDMYAEKAITLVAKSMLTCYTDGDNIDARNDMCLADTCSGVAINHAVVTLGHVIAHVIGGHYHDIAHGDALFSIYPQILRYNSAALPEKHKWIAQQIKPGCDDIECALDDFLSKFDFPNRLKAKNPDSAMIQTIADETFTYMEAITELNCVAAGVDDVKAILTNSLK